MSKQRAPAVLRSSILNEKVGTEVPTRATLRDAAACRPRSARRRSNFYPRPEKVAQDSGNRKPSALDRGLSGIIINLTPKNSGSGGSISFLNKILPSW